MGLERIENLPRIKNGYFLIFCLIAIDLISKLLAERSLDVGQSISFVPFVDFLLVFNSGIAFSMLDFNNVWLSFGLSVFGLGIVLYLHSIYKNEAVGVNRLALILIISGALGNILDRLPDGLVTDFLYLHIGNTPFFIFNLADAFITIVAGLFFIMEFKKYLMSRPT